MGRKAAADLIVGACPPIEDCLCKEPGIPKPDNHLRLIYAATGIPEAAEAIARLG